MRLGVRLLGLVSLLGVGATPASPPEEPKPLHKAAITCFNNPKDESGSLCSASSFQADGTSFKSGKLTCGYAGKVSEIRWEFLGIRGSKDKYRFTRRFPVDSADEATSSKEVEFEGKRLNVFEDEDQRIIVDAPKKADTPKR